MNMKKKKNNNLQPKNPKLNSNNPLLRLQKLFNQMICQNMNNLDNLVEKIALFQNNIVEKIA